MAVIPRIVANRVPAKPPFERRRGRATEQERDEDQRDMGETARQLGGSGMRVLAIHELLEVMALLLAPLFEMPHVHRSKQRDRGFGGRKQPIHKLKPEKDGDQQPGSSGHRRHDLHLSSADFGELSKCDHSDHGSRHEQGDLALHASQRGIEIRAEVVRHGYFGSMPNSTSPITTPTTAPSVSS